MNKRVKTGVGLTSILLILIAFCITVFAVQGYMTAKNNLAITDERVKYTNEYYSADKAANEIRYMVDSVYSDFVDGKITNDEFTTDIKAKNEIDDVYKDGNNIFVTYEVKINDDADLYVVLDYFNLQKGSMVKSWKVINKELDIDDKPLNLWDGK